MPDTIRSVLNNQRVRLRSDGSNIRDYIYVRDIAEAYLQLAEKTPFAGIRGEAFNFSNDCKATVLEIARKIQHLMERSDLEPIVLNETEAEIKDQYLDSSKARRLLNWEPQYSLEQGLTETIGWYREFFEANK